MIQATSVALCFYCCVNKNTINFFLGKETQKNTNNTTQSYFESLPFITSSRYPLPT